MTINVGRMPAGIQPGDAPGVPAHVPAGGPPTILLHTYKDERDGMLVLASAMPTPVPARTIMVIIV